jgi:heptosyltransferase-2
MKRLFQRAIYLFVRAVETALALLPMPWVWRAGAALGAVAHALLPGYRALARANHRIAFGAEMPEPAVRGSVRRMFRHLGGNLLGGVRLAQAPAEELRDRLRIEGLEHFRQPALEGRGNIIAVLHMGGWETFAQARPLFDLPGHRLATIYQPLGNPFLDARVRATRERRGIEAISRTEGFREAIKILRAGGIVGVLIDQHAGDAGLWTPFFGRLASTTTLPALLAARTGAPLQIASAITESPGRWRLRFRPVCDRPAEQSVESMTAQLNRAAEREIRQAPHEWFWVHRRWKTPCPKFLLRTYRRGIHVPADTPLKPFRIVVRSPNWLGDAVMSVPAVRAIQAGRPDAHVTVFGPEKLRDLWTAVPGVDAFLGFPAGASVFAAARLLRTGFDAAVILPNSVRSALEPWLAGIPRRVGFAARWRTRLLNQVVPEPRKPGPPRHQSLRYLDIALRIGADARDATFAIPPVHAEIPEVRIGLCPGAEYGPAKRWPAEWFAAVARRVSERRACVWEIYGTAADAGVARSIAAGAGDAVRDRTGQTTLAELIAGLRACRLLVTNDTGTMHLAALLGIPVVAIFGSTEPRLTGPMGGGHTVIRHHAECSPCFLRTCPLDFRCMRAIGPDEVVEAVLRILDAPRPDHARAA